MLGHPRRGRRCDRAGAAVAGSISVAIPWPRMSLGSALGVQDFAAQGTLPNTALARMNSLVAQAVGYYGKYLPQAVATTLPTDGDTVREVCRVLAPVKIIASKHSVVQDFYLHF